MRTTDGNPGSTVCKKKNGIQFHRGLPDPRYLTQWFGGTRGGVLVLDDLGCLPFDRKFRKFRMEDKW